MRGAPARLHTRFRKESATLTPSGTQAPFTRELSGQSGSTAWLKKSDRRAGHNTDSVIRQYEGFGRPCGIGSNGSRPTGSTAAAG